MQDEQISAPKDAQEVRARQKAWRMARVTVIILVLIVAAFAAFSGAPFLDFRLSVLLKLGAGVLATIVLAAGLMAAAFYSDASGHDDDTPGV